MLHTAALWLGYSVGAILALVLVVVVVGVAWLANDASNGNNPFE